MIAKHNLIRKKDRGKSATEFALMFPIFVATLIGLASISVLFYSYVTAQLAVREGASALIRNPSMKIGLVRNTVCTNTFAFDLSQVSVKVEPPDNAGTAAVSCSSVNTNEVAFSGWSSGRMVVVTAFYNVPLPTVRIPTLSSGGGLVLLGPIQIKTVSQMTME